MSRVRALLTLVALVPLSRAAHGQPVDPYNPGPASPAPPASGPRAPASGPASPPAAGPASGPTPPTAPAPPAREPAPGPATRPAAPGAPAPASPSPGPAAPSPSDAPLDPYAPGSPPLPPGQDPVLAERIAASLVTRAQDLLDGRVFLDAKQLAVEALVQSPHGPSSDHARSIIHAVNHELGIPEDSPRPEPPPPAKPEDTDTSPIQDPTLAAPPVAAPAEGGFTHKRMAATVHAGLYAGLLGATIGSFFSSDTPAAGAVPLGIAGGIAGGIVVPRLIDRLGWNEAQIRTVGAGTVWGGMIGGLFGDIVQLNGTTARQVLVGATLGSTIAGLGGYAIARDNRLTRGDVALIDTLSGIGAAEGLTLGMVMQPARHEAYSLNAVIGITAGAITGYVAGPMTNTTPRRMLRVAGLAAAGGAAPFLLYAAIRTPTSTADERVTGVLSSAGLVAGAWIGFRLTDGMDEGLDTLDGKPARDPDDAPVALIGRSSSGRWGIGGLGLSPLSPKLAPQPGLALQLVGAAF